MEIKEESQYIRPEMEIVSVWVGSAVLNNSPENPEEDEPGTWS